MPLTATITAIYVLLLILTIPSSVMSSGTYIAHYLLKTQSQNYMNTVITSSNTLTIVFNVILSLSSFVILIFTIEISQALKINF